MTAKPELFWGMIASMWVGNFLLVVLNLVVDFAYTILDPRVKYE